MMEKRAYQKYADRHFGFTVNTRLHRPYRPIGGDRPVHFL